MQPGKAKAGSKCDVTITHTDIFATCAAIAGAKLPEDAADLGETENVANKYPEIVKRLTARCEELREAGRSR